MSGETANITINQATESDLDAVASLFDGYLRFYDHSRTTGDVRAFLADRMEKGESVVFIARAGSDLSPAGFTQLYPSFSSIRMKPIYVLNDLFVPDSSRGSGVGRALMERAIRFARDEGRGALTLETATDNTVAKALYESLRFTRDEGFDHYTLGLE